MRRCRRFPLSFWALVAACSAFAAQSAPRTDFTLAQVLHYPFANELAAAERANVIAWVRNVAGVRNVWVARGPDFAPHQVTQYAEDDGQEITQLTFSPDGARLVYVRGGDHDANWPAEGNLAPDPASSPDQPVTTLWSIPLAGGAPQKIAEGDSPAISSRGQLVYTKDDHVWRASLDGEPKPERLFFDRGKDSELRWSPDGSRLAFVSGRGDHAFIGIFAAKDQPLLYLAPSTGRDLSPRWSPDGTRVAFVRRPGEGGAPEPFLERIAHPWSIWVASVDSGAGRPVWQSPQTLAGSFPEVEGEANLHWVAGDRLVFLAYLDEWPHLYSLAAGGGAVTLLTPGAFMVEHVTASRDRRFMIYSANTGTSAGDLDRRHLFRVPVDGATSVAITSGDTLEWAPVSAAENQVAFVAAGAQQPPAIAIVGVDGKHRAALDVGPLPANFPVGDLIAPRPVVFQAADGVRVHGQLFAGPGGRRTSRPGILFVHGGPPRRCFWGGITCSTTVMPMRPTSISRLTVLACCRSIIDWVSAMAALSSSRSTGGPRVHPSIRTCSREPASCKVSRGWTRKRSESGAVPTEGI